MTHKAIVTQNASLTNLRVSYRRFKGVAQSGGKLYLKAKMKVSASIFPGIDPCRDDPPV